MYIYRPPMQLVDHLTKGLADLAELLGLLLLARILHNYHLPMQAIIELINKLF